MSPSQWSHDFFTSRAGENFKQNLKVVQAFQDVAKRRGCTPAQLSLAWCAAQGVIAIPGTTKVHRLEENMAARDIELNEDDLRELRQVIDAAKPVGKRCVLAARSSDAEEVQV